MKTAILLLNYNGIQYLPDFFASLSHIDFAKTPADIFFIDNASSDSSVEWVKEHLSSLKPPVFIVENKRNEGFARGHNVVLKDICVGDEYAYVALVNIDTRVDADWLWELVQKAQNDELVGAVQSLILLDSETDRINTSGNKLHYLGFGWSGECRTALKDSSLAGRGGMIGYASGASVLYKTSVLKKVGIFEKNFFMYHEDLEISWRIWLAGFTVVLAHKSIVYHKYHFSRHKKKWYWAERNRLYTCLSLYKIPTLIALAPAFIFVELGVLCYSIMGGWVHYKMKAYLDVFLNSLAIIKKRMYIHSIRSVSDKKILRIMESTLQFSEVKNKLIPTVINPVLKAWYFVAGKIIFW